MMHIIPGPEAEPVAFRAAPPLFPGVVTTRTPVCGVICAKDAVMARGRGR